MGAEEDIHAEAIRKEVAGRFREYNIVGDRRSKSFCPKLRETQAEVSNQSSNPKGKRNAL